MKQFDFSKTETYLNEVVSVEELKDYLARHCLTLGEFITEDNCLVIGFSTRLMVKRHDLPRPHLS